MQFRVFVRKIVRSEIDFTKLQKNYRIDSLALHKLNLTKIIDFYRQIEVKYNFQSKKGKTWFENELRVFIWIVFNFANYLNKKPNQMTRQEWKEVSKHFHKDDLTCKYFFLCVEKNRKSQWTTEEDKVVIESITKPTFTNEWTEIGKELFILSQGTKFKKPKQIRERWNNYLNPNVSKDKWSIDEELALFRVISKEGRKWALISKILKTRSEHSVKNRYTNLLKKFKTQNANSVRFKRSELQTQFIRFYLKKLQEEKMSSTTHPNYQHFEKGENHSIEKKSHLFEDSHIKDSIQSLPQVSMELQYIKSPICFQDKQDDFMSTENLIRSFHPSYHGYMF